jgi:hypothetical protein
MATTKKKTPAIQITFNKLSKGKRVACTTQTQQHVYQLRNRGYDIELERTPRGNYYSM